MRRNRKRLAADRAKKKQVNGTIKELKSKLNLFEGKDEDERKEIVLDAINGVKEGEVYPKDLEENFDALDRKPSGGGTRDVGLNKVGEGKAVIDIAGEEDGDADEKDAVALDGDADEKDEVVDLSD